MSAWNELCNSNSMELNRKGDGGVMVYRVFLGVIALMLASKHSLGASTIPPVLVDVAISHSFVPMGFDSNDRAQLAIGGELKNSCFKIAGNSAVVDSEKKTITVKQQAYVYMGYCLMVIVPYTEIVTLGIVDQPGDYKVIDGSNKKVLGQMRIEAARIPEQDEFLYAPVSDVNVVHDMSPDAENDPERNKVVLSGFFTNNCTQFREVKVSYHDNTVVIQPITEYMPKIDGGCSNEKVNFNKMVVLDPKLKGDYLIHVRSLNGAAINKLVYFE